MINRAIDLFENMMDVEVFLSENFNQTKFLNKISNVVNITNRPGHKGDQSAGIMAIRRLLVRAKEESKKMPSDEAKLFLSKVRDITSRVVTNNSKLNQSDSFHNAIQIDSWVIVTHGNRSRSIGKVIGKSMANNIQKYHVFFPQTKSAEYISSKDLRSAYPNEVYSMASWK